MAIEGKITSLYTDKTMSEALLPRTNTKAITDDKGVNLNAILNQVAYVDTENSEAAVAPLNADTLAGFPADNYASKTYVSNEIAKAQLDGGSGEGDIDLSGFATKDDIATSANTTLDSAKTYTNDKIATIDFPVDSVNGKTGAVTLSAADIGAMANTSAKWLPQNGMSIRDFPSGITMYSVNPGNMIAEGVPTGFSEYATVTGFKLGEYDYYEYTDVFGHKAIWNTNANNEWVRVYSTATKPTAVEIGAQPALGFTPVQQGLNASGGNRIQLAWGNADSGKYALMCYIDGTYTGKVVTDNASFGGITPITNGGTGATTAAVARTNLGAAPSGYGLGEYGGFTITSGGDCNYARENGWYYVTGAPNAASEYDHVMLVASYGQKSVHQIAFLGDYISSNIYIKIRKCASGTWGEWEWLNPEMMVGVEYRTTERWNIAPVYTQIVDLGTTTADMSATANVSGIKTLIRAIPILNSAVVTEWDKNSGVHVDNAFYFCPEKNGSSGVAFYVHCGAFRTGKNLKVQLWYTKN